MSNLIGQIQMQMAAKPQAQELATGGDWHIAKSQADVVIKQYETPVYRLVLWQSRPLALLTMNVYYRRYFLVLFSIICFCSLTN